ncbi:MAG: type II secretion system protein [Synergistaceae bacterium]|nr:type II secretion system protein [Synergistaceae bacterium]
MTRTRKGFTLVELLIVIVVIGILSAMMMMSSSEAVTSAKASTIISNLRNLKTAALAYYNDNMDNYDSGASGYTTNGKFSDTEYTNLCAYLNGKNEVPDKDAYWIQVLAADSNHDSGWFVVYAASTATGNEGNRIRTKLAGRAKSLGLVVASGNYNTAYTYSGSGVGDNVALQVR